MNQRNMWMLWVEQKEYLVVDDSTKRPFGYYWLNQWNIWLLLVQPIEYLDDNSWRNGIFGYDQIVQPMEYLDVIGWSKEISGCYESFIWINTNVMQSAPPYYTPRSWTCGTGLMNGKAVTSLAANANDRIHVLIELMENELDQERKNWQSIISFDVKFVILMFIWMFCLFFCWFFWLFWLFCIFI